MKTNKVHARMPMSWNDFGESVLSAAGEEVYVSLIGKRLPEPMEWCGDELIGPVDLDWDPEELPDVLAAAYEEMCSQYSDDQYWMTSDE